MNSDGRIYRAPEDEIPVEDKARLDGYLRGRAEADAAAVAKERAEALAELEAEYERVKAGPQYQQNWEPGYPR